MITTDMNLGQFAERLTETAVEYREEPFTLRAGGMSHWYVDHRVGLGVNDMIIAAAGFIVAKAEEVQIEWEVAAGGGVGGRGLAIMTAIQGDKSWAIANLDKTDTKDFENGYGLHGSKVKHKKVLLVDDIGSSGSSIIELVEMVRENGGEVEHAVTISDRSNGKAAEALAEIGLIYHALLEFDETTGKLIPIA